MFAYASRCAAVAGVLAIAGLTSFTPSKADPPAMRINGWTTPPVGYVEFCRTSADQCAPEGKNAPVELSTDHWQDLQEVNALVNRIVEPVTDIDYYRREEVWAVPGAYGDCEDYVLLKRKWLAERGWPTGALLVTVVFDEVGDGHAVLLVRTSRGDLVLDNKTDDIRAWYSTAYRYVKRQSVSDPRVWVSVGDPRWTTNSTAASR